MCSLCRLPVAKNHNFGQILTIWGLLYRTPFYRWRPNVVCYSRPMVYAYVPNFVSIGLFCCPLLAKKFQFLPFSGLLHLVLSPIGSSPRKLNTGAQLQTFPYQAASKSFLYSNVFMAKSGAQSLTFKSVTNKQTDRQTDKKTQRFWPSRSPTKLGMVIEDLERVVAPWKLLGSDRLTHGFAARGRWKSGISRPPQFKTSITPWANPTKF